MPTNVRPEVSEKNQYYLDRERYYELKHFCRQYHIWKKAYNALDGMSKRPDSLEAFGKTNQISDPTGRCVEAREAYARKIEMVEKCAKEASPELASYILKYATNGDGYSVLKLRDRIPCCKEIFYDTARKFFWLLSKVRD